MRMVVDFPAPFGPRKPVTMPGLTVKVRLLTAVFSPYRLVRPSSSIMRTTLGPVFRECQPAGQTVADECDKKREREVGSGHGRPAGGRVPAVGRAHTGTTKAHTP